VFGGIKHPYNLSRRSRMLDGLIDQIEIYNDALPQSDIRARYDAIAIPEPSTLALLCMGTIGMLFHARRRRR